MTETNKITSTEKLLDIIRTNAGKGAQSAPRETDKRIPVRPPIGNGKSKQAKISSKTATTVGVDIGYEYLRLVKTAQGAHGVPVLIDQKRVLIPPSMDRDSAEFSNLLKSVLNYYCNTKKKPQIWAIMSAAQVEVHHTRVPKVPKKQFANVIYWTAKKESPYDEKENIFDFEVMGEVLDQGIAKWAVMYYTAPKQEIEDKKNLFSRAGWPLTGLSITPFAMQNIFRTHWLVGDEAVVATLFIGNDFSRIEIYDKGNIVMTRDIKAGVSSMLESLLDGINERIAARGAGEGKTPPDKKKAREILFSLSPDAPPLTEEARYGLQEAEIWGMALPAVERLVRQVERTFEHFTSNLGNNRVDKIYVSSAMSVYRPMAEYVGAQLGMASDFFDPLSAKVSNQHADKAIFPSISERIAFAPALGIALSDNAHTPNLIYTYKDKERGESIRRINMVIFVAFMVFVSLSAGFFLYELHAIGQKQKTMLQLESQLSQYHPPVNEELIMKTLMTNKQNLAAAKAYGQRYQGLAIISELSHLASRDIRLINIKTKLGKMPERPKEAAPAKPDAVKAKPEAALPKPEEAPAKPKEETKELEIEGYVTGEKKVLDAALGAYTIKLDNSPLFRDIKVQKTSEETFWKASLLRFTLTMKVKGL